MLGRLPRFFISTYVYFILTKMKLLLFFKAVYNLITCIRKIEGHKSERILVKASMLRSAVEVHNVKGVDALEPSTT